MQETCGPSHLLATWAFGCVAGCLSGCLVVVVLTMMGVTACAVLWVFEGFVF